MNSKLIPAVVITDNGDRFDGFAYGSAGRAIGHAVAIAQTTGYQEVLTDPVHAGAIIVFSGPHIGVTGVNETDARSDQVQASGLVVRDPARITSNFRATASLVDDLDRSHTVGAQGVDTRAIVRHIRANDDRVWIGIFSGDEAALPTDELTALVQHAKEAN